MPMFLTVLQIVIGLGVLNVWILRFKKATPYRGGAAASLPEEFRAYGLPGWFTYAVGTVKVTAACCLIAGVWIHILTFPAAAAIGVMMIGALAMHLKIGDPILKSLPAFLMLAMCTLVCWGTLR